MSEVEHSSGIEFEQAVLLLANECIELFEREASPREISFWVDRIPRRFPQFKICNLLEAVKDLLDEKKA
jgi:hypothetical protein